MDVAALREISSRFRVREVRAGQVLVDAGQPVTEAYLVVHGRFTRYTIGKYGEEEVLGVISDGDGLGDEAIGHADPLWLSSVRADTAGVLLALNWDVLMAFVERTPSLAAQFDAFTEQQRKPVNRKGEADVPLEAGHVGELTLPGGFVDYDLAPREYELSLTQTVFPVPADRRGPGLTEGGGVARTVGGSGIPSACRVSWPGPELPPRGSGRRLERGGVADSGRRKKGAGSCPLSNISSGRPAASRGRGHRRGRAGGGGSPGSSGPRSVPARSSCRSPPRWPCSP